MIWLWIVVLVLMSATASMAVGVAKEEEYSLISSLNYSATSFQCEFHPVSEPLSQITCGALCLSRHCTIFGVKAGTCAVCWKCNTCPPNPPGLILFDVMFSKSKCQLE